MKYLTILLAIVFLSSMTFALTEKSFNKLTNEVTIKDNNLNSAIYKLSFNSDQCLTNCFAEGTAILYKSSKLFDSIKFIDKSNINKNLNYRFYIKKNVSYEIDNSDYKEICSGSKNDTKCTYEKTIDKKEVIYKYEWSEYKGELLSSGIYEWKIEANKKIRDKIDWIVTANSIQLTEWDWWSSNWQNCKNISINNSLTLDEAILNVNITGLTFENTSEIRIINAPCWNDGSEIKSTVLSNDSTSAFITFLANLTGTDLNYSVYYNNKASPVKTLEASPDFCEFNTDICDWIDTTGGSYTITDEGTFNISNVGGFGNWLGIYSPNQIGTKNIITRNQVIISTEGFMRIGLADAPNMSDDVSQLIVYYDARTGQNKLYQSTLGAGADDEQELNDINSQFQRLWFNIGSNGIENVSQYSDVGIILNQKNGTVARTESNMTLAISAVANSIATSIDYIRAYDLEANYVNDVDMPIFTIGDEELSNDLGIVINSVTYNSLVSELSTETISINITYNSTKWSSVSGELVYNGTSYNGTLTSTGSDTIISQDVIIPISNEGDVYSFYWNISLTNSTDTYYYASSEYTQTASSYIMSTCGIDYNDTFINFTIKNVLVDETLNASFKSTFYYGLTTPTENFSYENTSEQLDNFPFCFFPSSDNFTIDAVIEYDADGYAKNYYYINNLTISNDTTNIILYLLNDSFSSTTVLKVQSSTKSPLDEVYIQIQKYDSGTDTYYTVAMAKTGYDGLDVAYLNWYDTFYKYNLIRNNNLIYFTNASKISESPVVFTIPIETDFTYMKFEDIVYNLYFNNDTNNFVLTYSNIASGITSVCLRVDKKTASNDTNICNTCETSSSATIYCNINDFGNGTYYASAYATGSLAPLDSLVEIVGTINEFYEEIGALDGAFYAFLFGAIILVMFLISPVFAIIGTLVGMIGSMALGFTPVNYMEFLGIVIIGGVIILILKR